MPVNQVVLSYVAKNNYINVLLLRSFDLSQPGTLHKSPVEMIEVSPNGFTFSEPLFEYRIMLDNFFKLATKSETGDLLYNIGKVRANNVQFGLRPHWVDHLLMEHYHDGVGLGDLPLRISSAGPVSLHCSTCANMVIDSCHYRRIQPVPVITMRPARFFCGRNNIQVYPREDQLFYGLNYVVICFLLMGDGLIRTHRRLECSRCRQVVGNVLGCDVAIQLYADAVRMMSSGPDSLVQFKEIFGHVTPTQLMIRLLNDDETIVSDMTHLLLKALRPDGQLNILLLMVEKNQLQILRSQLPDARELELPNVEQKPPNDADTSSESDLDSNTSSSSDSSSGSSSDSSSGSSSDSSSGSSSGSSSNNHKENKDTELPNTVSGAAADLFQVLQPPGELPKTTIKYLELRGFRGCRIKYVFSGTDEELKDNHEKVEQCRNSGTHIFRISYPMMVELLTELNVNENMVAALENLPLQKNPQQPRISYIIYETDKDYYARQRHPLAEPDI